MMYEEGNERGHRVAHYLEERCCIPDSATESRSALAEKARSSGASRKEKKNQAASERSDLVKSRQGIGRRASLGPEPQLTQSNDTCFYERENMDSPKTQEKETH